MRYYLFSIGFRQGERNVLIESKKLALLKDVCAGPPCRVVSCPKSWGEVMA